MKLERGRLSSGGEQSIHYLTQENFHQKLLSIFFQFQGIFLVFVRHQHQFTCVSFLKYLSKLQNVLTWFNNIAKQLLTQPVKVVRIAKQFDKSSTIQKNLPY